MWAIAGGLWAKLQLTQETMMQKCRSEKEATVVAERDGLSIGMSVFDGLYYAGHDTELLAIGCVMIQTPIHPSHDPYHKDIDHE